MPKETSKWWIGEWIGPFYVATWDQSKKIVFVRDIKVGPHCPFNVTQVKKYLSLENAAHSHLLKVVKSLHRFSNINSYGTRLTGVLTQIDPRAKSAKKMEAIKRDVTGLMSRGTFKVADIAEIPPRSSVLPCKLVWAVKEGAGGMDVYKARFVVGGHRDKYKVYLVHYTQKVQPSSTRLLLAIADMFSFDSGRRTCIKRTSRLMKSLAVTYCIYHRYAT